MAGRLLQLQALHGDHVVAIASLHHLYEGQKEVGGEVKYLDPEDSVLLSEKVHVPWGDVTKCPLPGRLTDTFCHSLK